MRAGLSMQRTDWAERHVEDFLSLPLVREFVYRSPMAMIGNVEKEVGDILCQLDNLAFLISQKCQQEPGTRSKEKEIFWVKKEARGGAKQLTGALRTGHTRPMWCLHSRLGRVEFPDGLPAIKHGIVLVETLETVVLDEDEKNYPQSYNGVPISYFGLNDFLNLAFLLRTLPELMEYLDARSKLDSNILRAIGIEKMLYETYQLQSGSFKNINNVVDVIDFVLIREAEIKALYEKHKDTFIYTAIVENVSDALAERDPDLPKEIEHHFEPIEERKGYRQLQAVLANTRLAERIIIGQTLHEMRVSMQKQNEGMVMCSRRFDSLPDIVFVLGVWKKFDRKDLPSVLQTLIRGARAFYTKGTAFGVFDRDGDGYDVQMYRSINRPTAEEIAAGKKFFGHLKVDSRSIGILG